MNIQNTCYKSLCTVLDCLIEGVLIINSKNDFVVNKRFKEIFNVNVEKISEVFETLKNNGLIELLDRKRNIFVNYDI